MWLESNDWVIPFYKILGACQRRVVSDPIRPTTKKCVPLIIIILLITLFPLHWSLTCSWYMELKRSSEMEGALLITISTSWLLLSCFPKDSILCVSDFVQTQFLVQSWHEHETVTDMVFCLFNLSGVWWSPKASFYQILAQYFTI
jgi:hypothetical protein